jgi:glycosyltransferase involved in cell wall biosynthesis
MTAAGEAFVQQELQAIEAAGWRVRPFALQAPAYPSRDAVGLAQRTVVLRQGGRLRQAVHGLWSLLRLGRRALPAMAWLLQDLQQVGWFSRQGRDLIGSLLMAAQLARALAGERCTHLHAHFAHAPADVAMYASALLRLPFTFTGHAQDLFRHTALLRRKALRARAVLTISHHNRDWLVAQGVDPDRVDVVRCAPEATSTTPGSPQRLRTGPYRIGCAAALIERQGVDDILRALAQLIRSHCAPVKLLVAGEGPERLRLQVLADQLGIHRQVEFLGHLPVHALPHWMRGLDVFVAAPRADRQGNIDGIPVTLMEAMAAGVPAVATRLGGIPELVIDGQTGYLAEPGDPASLAAQIDRAMSEPERARSLGRSARAHVRWEFGREVNVRRLLRHFGESDASATRPEPLHEAA